MPVSILERTTHVMRINTEMIVYKKEQYQFTGAGHLVKQDHDRSGPRALATYSNG